MSEFNYKKHYDEMFSRMDKFKRNAYREELRKEQAALIDDVNARILDVGCGDGIMLTELGDKAIGLDISNEALKFAPENIRDRLRQGCATELPFDNESFDTVLLLNMIEHLTPNDAKKALSEANRVCAKNGQIIISTCIRVPKKFEITLDMSKYLHSPTHLKEYFVEELDAMLSEHFTTENIITGYGRKIKVQMRFIQNPYIMTIVGRKRG